jgi:hypothetical protein
LSTNKAEVIPHLQLATPLSAPPSSRILHGDSQDFDLGFVVPGQVSYL